MKKTFKLSHPTIKYPRLIEATKSEVKKYLKRERNKTLPDYADFWGFDCRFGQTQDSAVGLYVGQINEKISFAESQEWTSFYLEILAVPAQRTAREEDDTEIEYETDLDEVDFDASDDEGDRV
ncbi:DUF6172 family protein [Marinomonas sp. IMCC 4694]|uniref:DUF6172 family protein n=1 Tax=Marinomonas sp. IMCC 4694 TaxID=2605432 RepID=UPI0011E85907|nr:DUF6172 family protein [Marinomonas sp. IMCC 4694]TYL48774.1 hypothetical protein FXV75_13080 [Marinomonas sp. IMCC 4694]